jgi:outer membrane protein assembly factor BamB
MNTPRVAAILVVAISLILNTRAATNQWSQWRGPQARGVDDTTQLSIHWNVETGENIPWRTPVPGLAHSSPIVWNDRIYVATAVKPGKAELKVGLYGSGDSANEKEIHQWRLLALDRTTGKILWNQLAHEGVPKQQRHTKASQCNSTPSTDGTNIVAIFGSEGLFCFDASGMVRWRKDLGPMDAGWPTGPSALQWGFGSSPIIHNGLVIVQCDVLSEQYVAAFRVEDGREVWRTRRNEVGTWSTPTIETGEGRGQVILNGYKQTAGYDLDTGKERWHLNGGGDIPVPTPIVAHGLIFLTSAHGNYRPMRALRPDPMGDITPEAIDRTNAAIVWTHPRQGSYMQTPIVVGDLLYGCHDTGVLTCFDARTGRIHYSERLAAGSQGFSASPVSDGRNLYFTGEMGDVYVVPAGPKFSVAATNKLAEICMATPAISHGTLFFRTREHVVAIGAKK